MINPFTAGKEAREAERLRYRQAIAERITAGDTPEQAFAHLYLDDAAEEAIVEVGDSKRRSHRITMMALAVSLPHQIGFFLSVAELHFMHDLVKNFHPLSILFGAVLIPLIIDASIVHFVKQITMKVTAQSSRIYAAALLAIPASCSAYINFVVPAPHRIMNWAFGGAVLAIPLVYGYKAFFWKPDFRQMVLEKQDTLAQVAPVTAEPAVDEEARARRSESARRGAATRKEREARETAAKAAKAQERKLARDAKKLPRQPHTAPTRP